MPRSSVRFPLVLTLALPLVLDGCATGGAASTPRASRNVITAEELATVESGNAYDAVNRLRPQWLQVRGTMTGTGGAVTPIVFLDGVRLGDVSQLRGLAVADLDGMQFRDGREATTLYGTGVPAGVIEVRSRR